MIASPGTMLPSATTGVGIEVDVGGAFFAVVIRFERMASQDESGKRTHSAAMSHLVGLILRFGGVTDSVAVINFECPSPILMNNG